MAGGTAQCTHTTRGWALGTHYDVVINSSHASESQTQKKNRRDASSQSSQSSPKFRNGARTVVVYFFCMTRALLTPSPLCICAGGGIYPPGYLVPTFATASSGGKNELELLSDLGAALHTYAEPPTI